VVNSGNDCSGNEASRSNTESYCHGNKAANASDMYGVDNSYAHEAS